MTSKILMHRLQKIHNLTHCKYEYLRFENHIWKTYEIKNIRMNAKKTSTNISQENVERSKKLQKYWDYMAKHKKLKTITTTTEKSH